MQTSQRAAIVLKKTREDEDIVKAQFKCINHGLIFVKYFQTHSDESWDYPPVTLAKF